MKYFPLIVMFLGTCCLIYAFTFSESAKRRRDINKTMDAVDECIIKMQQFKKQSNLDSHAYYKQKAVHLLDSIYNVHYKKYQK